MTEKQEIFKSYLKKQIGFIEDTFCFEYIKLLSIIAPRYTMLLTKKSIVKSDKEDTSSIKFAPNIIDLLLIEIDLKKNAQQFRKNDEINTITATDIANYTYCPVSYAIGKTYKVPTNEDAILGQALHERKWLINYFQKKYNKQIAKIKVEKVTFNKLNFGYENLFDDIKTSIPIYQGHQNDYEKLKYFSKGNFRGSPDYIFYNENNKNYFVIEEKYQWVPKKLKRFANSTIPDEVFDDNKKKRNRLTFFENHQNQLLSYIYGIPDYKIDYGYLLYWKYELNDQIPTIISCDVLKITKSEENRRKLLNKYLSLSQAIKNNGDCFNPINRQASKCAGCVNGLFCGHKTGKFNKYTIPYDNDYLKINYIPFPHGLMRQDDDEGFE